MRSNLKQILIFLLLLLAAVYAIQYTIDYSYRKRVVNKFTKLLNHKTDNTIMIFGSSVAYHQFNTAIIDSATGNKSYNMGWPGMFFIQYNGLINEYLSYQKNCKYIVLGCDFDNLGQNDLITRPDLFLAYLGNNNIYRSLHEIEPYKMFNARYLPGYKLTLFNKPFYTDLALATRDMDSLSGYEPITTGWEQTQPKEPFNTRYNEAVFQKLSVTLANINKKGIKVILVIPPVYEEGYKLIQNAEAIKAKYRSLAGKDVYFLDYTSDTMCETRDHFHNFTHLNSMGASLFSRTFAHDLLKIIHE